MMSRLTALIPAKNRAQKPAASSGQKYTPMAVLQPGQLRSVAGGEGTDSPKGSW